MTAEDLAIGQLAAQTGTRVQTIRYYEQVGLMPVPRRTEGNQRRYGLQDLKRLAFIRHGRELGFSPEAIRQLLQLGIKPDRSCAAVDRIARQQLQHVRSRITRLKALEAELQRMIAQCRGRRIADCRVIETLANHAYCRADHHPERMSPF
jgi:DNA-binding transcriptional MerR regulator